MEGDDQGEAYTAIVWGGLLSRVSSNVVGAEAFSVAEGNMCGAVMQGAVALPRSKTPSRTKGDLASGRVAAAMSVRVGKARSRSR